MRKTGHINYTPQHNHFADYAPGDIIPYIFMQGKLRQATFLGKSLTHCLIEYEVNEQHFLIVCTISGDVVYPMGSEKQRKHAKYSLEYWCIERNFALLENAALNEAEWNFEKSLTATYHAARELMALGLKQRVAEGKKLRGHEQAVFRQPCLPFFDEAQRVGSEQK